MKKLFLLFAALVFTSCSSFSEKGYQMESIDGDRLIFETEDGGYIVRSSGYLDSLRGANVKRDAEQMEFSRNIIRKAGEPYVEYSLPPDPVPTKYTGRVKIVLYGGGKFTAMREVESNTPGVTKWQGPNPPTGWYGWQKAEEIIISDLSPENIERLAKEGIIL